MNKLHLNAENAASRSMLHTTLAEALSFPDWYGRNLDALYDCLTDISEDTELTMEEGELAFCLGERYVDQLHRLLQNAAAENPHILFSE